MFSSDDGAERHDLIVKDNLDTSEFDTLFAMGRMHRGPKKVFEARRSVIEYTSEVVYKEEETGCVKFIGTATRNMNSFHWVKDLTKISNH